MRQLILGTDWGTDCDDCVAIRILANAHKSCEIKLLAVGIDACMEYSAPSLSAFLTAEGLPDIPIGIDCSATDVSPIDCRYQEALCGYPHLHNSNEDYESTIDLYKRILSQCESKVDIVEIGFNQVWADILSTHDGRELIAKMVNRFYIMAGRWDRKKGIEYNFANSARSRKAGFVVCDKCPVPITFLGFEVGETVLSGDGLPEDDILNSVLALYGCSEFGRSSWDPLTVLLAIIGDEEKAGYNTVHGTASVNPITGENSFVEGKGPHTFVIKTMPDDYYRNQIQERIGRIRSDKIE